MIDLLKRLWCKMFGHRRLESFWVRDDHGAIRLDFCPRCESIMGGDVEEMESPPMIFRVRG